MNKKLNLPVVMALIMMVLIAGCKKDEEIPESVLKEQQWSSEIYDYMQLFYLWNDALPGTFDAKAYRTAQSAFDFLTSLKINPATGKAIDRYSFLDKIGNLSGELGTGIASGDLGFMVEASYNASQQLSFFVTYVYRNSPAGKAGVTRGDEITLINGSTTVHPAMDSNGNLIPSSPAYVNMVTALYGSAVANFGLKRHDGSSYNVSLSPGQYAINAVLKDSVYKVGNDNVGYMVFNQFLDTIAQNEFINVINRFQSRNVTSLIVDLRYNGGGVINTCAKFCNMITPVSANGKRMYNEKYNQLYNDYLNSKKVQLFVNFTKTNSFSPTRLYFIVGKGTASASELLINNMRPYFTGNIYLIGSTTYGKPCGFWPIPIGYDDKQTTPKEGYDMYAVGFETTNANNEGGYYTGMTPGSAAYPGTHAGDSIKLDWGNTNDGCLKQALYHIANNAFYAAPAKVAGTARVMMLKDPIDHSFKGMIDYRHKALNLK